MPKVEGNPPKVEFAKGGTTKMFGPQHAGPPVEGRTSHEDAGNSGKFPSGGKGHMFGKGSARTMESGVTAKKSQ
jgi:hypothetical protein